MFLKTVVGLSTELEEDFYIVVRCSHVPVYNTQSKYNYGLNLLF